MNTSLGVISLTAVVVALAMTPLFRRLALRFRIGDLPGERKVHSGFVPRMGGGGIIFGFSAGMLVAWVLAPEVFVGSVFSLPGILLGLLLIIALGVFDDIRGVGSLGKLVVQLLASAAVLSTGMRIEFLSLPFVGSIDLGILSIPLTLLWLIGITNAVNLLDGLDGLACGVAAIVAASMFIMSRYMNDDLLMVASVALFFSCLGFLRYNFHKASVFMGDTGSLFLGFLLALLSLKILGHTYEGATPLSLLVVVVTLGVPIVDTSVAFFRRLKKGMHPLKPDKEHIHHRLMDLGLTHRQTVVTIYAITSFNGLIALLLVMLDSFYATIMLSIVLVAAVFSIGRLGYIEEMSIRRGDSKPPIAPLSVARMIDRAVLVAGDIIAIILAFLFSYWLRFHSGLMFPGGYVSLETYLISPAVLLLTVYWLGLFLLGGLYEMPWDTSRVDYGLTIMKIVSIGTLIVFIVTMDFSSMSVEGRLTTLLYGVVLAFMVLVIRMAIMAIERKYEILGFRRRNTIIIGTSQTATDILQEIRRRPGLKYNVIGVVDQNTELKVFGDLPVLGTHESIPEIVRKNNVEEILVATNYDSREEMLEIAARCNGMVPSVKVMPESLDVLSGFRTEEIIGHPLVRLYPTNLKAWQRAAKRLVDLCVSLMVLIPFLPLWLLIGVFIKLDSRGPVFFSQERVGKRGKLFTLYKFRSMIEDAERETGPVWATAGDRRITRVGRVLRALRLDEIPQFINVLKGEMSLVGPRPERPFFVEQLKNEVGFYTRRLLVRPGITGWAQIKLHYDTSLEDVRKKVKYDLYYLENMSLTLDLKILARTIIVALSGRGTH